TAQDGTVGPNSSAAITVSAGATAGLAFDPGPVATEVLADITPAVGVDIIDAEGNIVNSSAFVSIGFSSGGNANAAILTGGSAVQASNGMANFPNLSINQPGTGYILEASSQGFTVDSLPFDINGSKATITKMTPAFGPVAGGTVVKITGTGLTNITQIDFGSAGCYNAGGTGGCADMAGTTSVNGKSVTNVVTSPKGTSLAVVAPAPASTNPGPGAVRVSITTAAGSNDITAAASVYSYGPSISKITQPICALGSTTCATIKISGANLVDPANAATPPVVSFGSDACVGTVTTPVATKGNLLQVTPPLPGSSSDCPSDMGAVSIKISTSAGTNDTSLAASMFAYGPIVTKVSPNLGPLSNAKPISVTGANFTGATAVQIGSTVLSPGTSA